MDPAALDETFALVADGEAVLSAAGDIVDPATMDELVATAAERFGRVVALFNNVGIPPAGRNFPGRYQEYAWVSRGSQACAGSLG